jgi:hypothetical protein
MLDAVLTLFLSRSSFCGEGAAGVVNDLSFGSSSAVMFDAYLIAHA